MDARFLDALPLLPLGACRGQPDSATTQGVAQAVAELGQRLERACAARPLLTGGRLQSLPAGDPGEVLAAWVAWIGSPVPDTSGAEAGPLVLDSLEVLHLVAPGRFQVSMHLQRTVSGQDVTFAARLLVEALMPTVVAGRTRVRRGLMVMLIGLGLLFVGLIPIALIAELIGGLLMLSGYRRLGGPFTHQVWRHDPELAAALAAALRDVLGDSPGT